MGETTNPNWFFRQISAIHSIMRNFFRAWRSTDAQGGFQVDLWGMDAADELLNSYVSILNLFNCL